jgi:hypothetical protein
MANWGGNIIGGAGTGAAAGSAAGPWGALAGGVLGALAGVFTSLSEESDAKKKQEIIDNAKSEFNLTQDEIDTLMEDFYTNPDNFLGTKADVESYRKAIQGYDPSAFIYGYDGETGKFDENLYDFSKTWDKSVDDFVNPYYDKIIKNTSDKVQHSAAGAGVGRGTGAANAIAEAVAKKDDELYKTALQEYNTDRAQTYSEWSGNIDRMQQRLNQLKAATDTQMNNLGTLANDYTQQQQNYFSDQIASKQNRNNANLQLANMGLMI